MKPREKLAISGPRSLNDQELLSLLLGHGSKKENVFQISKRLFENFEYEEILNASDPKDLRKTLQLGLNQACKLMAAVELGKRFFGTPKSQKNIRNTEEAYSLLKNMQFLQKEYVRGLYLNSRYRIIHDEIISIGSLDGNILHPREVFRPAIEYGAFGFILAHNHPSGDSQPSDADLKITQKLFKLGNELHIPLFDHLVIGESSFTSIKKLLQSKKDL